MKKQTVSDLYIPIAWLILGIPVLCGCLVVLATFLEARHNVHIWRGEFQRALDAQCPALSVDILNGAGTVYLDATRTDYQWVGEEMTCSSNGRTVQCSCRSNYSDYTNVSKYADEP